MKRLILTMAVGAAFLVACGSDGPSLVGDDTGDDAGLYDVVNPEDPGESDSSTTHDTNIYLDTKGDDNGAVGTDTTNPGEDANQPGEDANQTGTDTNGGADTSTPEDINISWDTTAPSCDQEGITCIFLQNDHILVNGDGAVVDGTTVTINAAGIYSISGTLDDGQILVDTADKELVKLLFNGVQASSSTSSPLYIVSANNVELFLVAETMNSLTDATTYVYDTVGATEPNAALFCTADLDITGLGVLTLNGRYNDAINVKDGLDIMGGTIIANGKDDGIRGKDNVTITGGSVTVTATNNGIKADNDTDADRGYIDIQGGTVKVTSGGDGLTANTAITISGGSVQTITGGGSATTVADTASAKGIKGLGSVTITGGTINVDSADDGIHSNGPVTINGGDYTVKAALDGLHSETIMKVMDGTLNITSGGGSSKTIASTLSAKGIKGTLSANITGGEMTISSADDCIHSAGTVSVSGGNGTLACKADGIHAETILELVNGDYQVTTGGGSGSTTTATAKGLKGGTSVVSSGGTYNLNCADDGVHSDNAITINGGTFVISSSDDGFHGEETLKITNGDITINKSYEGLESKLITIDNGTIHLTSSDDGINVAGGDGSGGWNPGGGGTTNNYFLYINGGYIWMNAGGDGLDSNGNIVMTGGTVLVNGPTDNGNGPIDIGDGGSYYFKISGGFIVAAGSSGMAVGNSTSSTQYGVLVNLTSSQSAGTIFHLQTAAGADRLTFKPAKKWQSVFFSSPDMGTGSHVVYLGGSSTGTLVDNLYTGGAYTPGTQYTTFSVSSVSTRVGSGGGPGF